MLEDLKRITAVTGHYGCGKTNFTVNLALRFAAAGAAVTVADLDIVNPYFRTADFGPLLTGAGIKLIAPNFANTLVDIPSLPREVDGAIESDGRLLLDVGGDDAGAIVLGRYAKQIEANGGADLLYLFSMYRPFTTTPQDVLRHIREIEAAAGLRVTRLVNSSNLGPDTTTVDIDASRAYAQEVGALTGLPVSATLALEGVNIKSNNVFSVRRYVTLPWERVQKEGM
ncbi:MAG: cobalamin biosynthesis protein CobQ [Oscillospiraceae bacterium]|nr:cobalamin biosynthesis protein CobQ [Oscillospiraceae bacterium]